MNGEEISFPVFFREGMITISCPPGAREVIFSEEGVR
jgi:hypothetical protein